MKVVCKKFSSNLGNYCIKCLRSVVVEKSGSVSLSVSMNALLSDNEAAVYGKHFRCWAMMYCGHSNQPRTQPRNPRQSSAQMYTVIAEMPPAQSPVHS